MNRLGLILGLAAAAFACGDNLNVPPNAPDIEFRTDEDTPIRIDFTLEDPNGDTVTIALDTEPEVGTLDAREQLYTPAEDFNGSVVLGYSAADGLSSSRGLITIIVEPVNDPPRASAIVDFTTNVNQPLLIPFGVSDVDTPLEDIRTAAASGDVSVVPSENLVLGGVGANRDITVTAIAKGQALITVFVLDDDDISDKAFTLTVVNGAPLAVNDTYNVAAEAVLSVGPAIGLLANDTDVDDDPLTAIVQLATATTLGGSVNVNENGSFVYTQPAGGLAGQTDSFDYQVTDGADTGTGTASIAVE